MFILIDYFRLSFSGTKKKNLSQRCNDILDLAKTWRTKLWGKTWLCVEIFKTCFFFNQRNFRLSQNYFKKCLFFFSFSEVIYGHFHHSKFISIFFMKRQILTDWYWIKNGRAFCCYSKSSLGYYFLSFVKVQ